MKISALVYWRFTGRLVRYGKRSAEAMKEAIIGWIEPKNQPWRRSPWPHRTGAGMSVLYRYKTGWLQAAPEFIS
tara:strand:- start:293 stop:514 length:222 start_codon:yes stop_codon:yes gene_type:complete